MLELLDPARNLECGFAHLFGAKVYVTVNTIIYEDELDAGASSFKIEGAAERCRLREERGIGSFAAPRSGDTVCLQRLIVTHVYNGKFCYFLKNVEKLTIYSLHE